MKIKKHLQHLSQWSSKRTPLRYILVRQQHHFYIRSIRRRLKSLKRRHSRLIPFLIPILTTTLILLSTFFLLTALNSTPHAPGLKNGSGNTLFTAGNKTFSADIGTRDGSPQVAFQVESAVATFTLAGIDQSEGEKVGRDTVLFQDVLPSIDLQYTTLSNGVKEELIIKEPRTNNQELTTTFLFDLSLSGTTPKELTKRPDGVISLSPTFQDSNGEYLFHFEKPYAYDANGARTDNVLMQIGEDRSVPGKYYLKLTVDPTWLNDPARVYPVVIDPTVVHDTTTEFSAGTLDRVKDTGTGSVPSLETYYQELPADEHTVGLWHMNETSGTSVADSSGNGNTGTATGTTVVDGKLNNARSFNGTSSYIDAGNNEELQRTSDLTISAWINPSSTTSSNRGIVSKFYNSTGNKGYRLGLPTTDNKLRFEITSDGTTNVSGFGTTPLPMGVWTHVAAVYKAQNGEVDIYVNGKLDNTTTGLPSSIYNSPKNFQIGTWDTSVSNHSFVGSIDEVRISNIARTPEEIKSAASRRPSSTYTSDVIDLTDDVFSWTSLSWDEWGVATGDGETLYSSTGLVAQWNFNETSGTTADNAEGTASLDGTLSGFDSTASQDADPDSSWTANNRRWGAGALQFDGVDSYVQTSSTVPFGSTTSSPYTIESWFRADVVDGNIQIIVQGADGTGTGRTLLGIQANNYFYSNIGGTATYSTTIPTPGEWYHLAVVYDGTNETIYVNGRSEATASNTHEANTGAIIIGKAKTSAYYFDGTIDSTRIYSRALPAHEILSNYNSTNIEFQTRVGADTSPDDGDWDAWSSVSGETAIESFDTIESATRIYNTLIADSSTNQTWHKANNAIESPSDTTGTDGRLPLGSTGGDTTNIHSPSVIKDGSTYKMWYSGYDGTNYRIYHATSPDGLTWTKYDNSIESPSDTTGTNGRLPLGSTGGDTGRSTYSSIIKDGSTYKMWYTGHDGTTNRIFYATSPDGLTWTKYDNSIESPSDTTGTNGRIPLGSTGGDTTHVGTATVIKDGSTYKMWYYGSDGTNNRIYYATSPDGLTWTKYDNSIPTVSNTTGTNGRIPLGTAGTADSSHTYLPNVIKDGNTYKMWYTTHMGNTAISYATSPDGLTWTKLDNSIETISDTIGTNGRLPRGNSGTGDVTHAYAANVIKDGNTYKMWYTGYGGAWRIYYATMIPIPATESLNSTIKQEGSYSSEYSFGQPQVDGNTVALWHLDETGGTGAYIKDSSGNANHATPTGTTLTQAISRKGRSFNGTSDYISTPDSNSLDTNGNAITLEAWVKPQDCTGTGDGRQTILTKSSAYYLNLENTTCKPAFYWYGINPAGYHTADTAVPLNTWSYVVATYDGQAVSIYIDGKLNKTVGATGTGTINTESLRIGGFNSSARNLNGYLDEVKISNVARTAEEIAEAYRMGRDHYLNKTISPTDLSGKSSLPFYIAADRPGSYLSATVGESPYANYQPDANTVGLWHLDEKVFNASGGTITESGGYTIHTFTSGGTFTPNGNGSVEYLVVAGGGGGGGRHAGGGGGGGMNTGSLGVSSTAYSITVGGGGSAAPYGGRGGNGANSVFSTITSIGGGGGGGYSNGGATVNGNLGGSGGGGAEATGLPGGTGTYGAGTAGQGNRGGIGLGNGGTNDWSGGGGGGAGAVGGNAYATYKGGVGGIGISNSISGSSTYYAGGGGGGGGGNTDLNGGAGGLGGGGRGTGAYSPTQGVAGTANTGGGGGGSRDQAGSIGGSGIVIVRYPTPSLKDASGNANNGTPTGTTFTQGKIGKARSFNGSSDYVNVNAVNPFRSNFTVESWVKFNAVNKGTDNAILSNGSASIDNGLHLGERSGLVKFGFYSDDLSGVTPLQANTWYHLTYVYDGGKKIYVNGVLDNSGSSNTYLSADTNTQIGQYPWSTTHKMSGTIDEVRISDVARTPSEIRQAYEVGLRTHPITIDFGASLDSGNLIASSADLSFTVDATAYGLDAMGSALYEGDKIIVRENYDGTEHIAQGTVSAVTPSTGAVTVSSWDTGGTFPSGGFTANAHFFKWQREYWPVADNTLSDHMDAITNLTFRLTDGNEGRTIWLDDLRSTSGYLTDKTGSTITSNTGNQYFQYRAIMTSLDEAVSATLSAVTLDYVSNSAPATPSLDLPTDTNTNQLLLPVLKTTTTDADSDYIRYKIELCEDVGMSVSCQTFDQTSSQTGWSGQDAQTSTAYASGTQATYTLQSALNVSDSYYWRSYAIDPGGINTWSSTQGTPYSFTTTTAPTAPTTPYAEGATNPTGVLDLTPEFSAVHNDADGDSANYYQIEVNTANDFTGTVMWDSTKTSMTTTADGVRSPDISYAGTSLALDGTTYYWRIKFWDTLGAEGVVSATANFVMNTPPTLASGCVVQEIKDDSYLLVIWTDTADNENGYEVQSSVDGATFSTLQDLAADSTSHTDSTVTTGHTYRYRIAPYLTGPTYGDWCYTDTLSLSTGNFTFENIKFE